MKKSLILFLLSLFFLQAKANKDFDLNFASKSIRLTKLIEKDSSNYSLKVLDSDINYTQLRFTIIDEQNLSLNAVITLKDKTGDGISGVLTNDDGKIIIMIFDDRITEVIVGRIGFGMVSITIKSIKNKIVDVKVQLYTFKTTN